MTDHHQDAALAGLEDLIGEPEGERLEFKEARGGFHFERLAKYCAALSNEGGGSIVLGVTDRRPRRIVGTGAFEEPGRTVAGLTDRLRIKIECREVQHPDGRVLIFTAPPRPLGLPVHSEGIYWARAGDELRPMATQELQRAFDEAGPDFSAELHPSASLGDLDPVLIEQFRSMWRKKSGNEGLERLPPPQLLGDAELIVDGRVTIAALVMLGTREALGRRLAQAEVVFEYRSSDASIPHQQRIEYRVGILGILDQLWDVINLRNEVLHYQDGFFIGDIPAFNEKVVREAILNAVAHRDYRLAGSVFVRQYPRKLQIVSPGGFPPGITADNIYRRQLPRNRRLADACARIGWVERSGQGADRMFEESIKEGKPRPDFVDTDGYQVSLTLHGEIQNPEFLRFLERVAREQGTQFSLEDLLTLDLMQRDKGIPDDLKPRLARLIEEGVIERVGRGRGVRYIISGKFYRLVGQHGIYTRKKGLDQETNKALLLTHLARAGAVGAPMSEFEEVLPAASRRNILRLLQELRDGGKVQARGSGRWVRWHLGDGKN